MALPLSNGVWTIDPAHTQLGFSIRHLGIANIRGMFQQVEGAATVNGDSAEISVNAQMASVSTGNSYRDGHLQAGDFFDVENHPTMTFRSTGIELSGDDAGKLNGELTIRGITQPVSLDVTFHGIAPSPVDQTGHAGFEATGSISRSAFGVTFGAPMISDEVRLALDVQLLQPKD
jgi:polyisoprenoid-binding protein YceI